MIFVLLFAICIVFVELLIFFNIGGNARSIFHITLESFQVLQSSEMSDYEKESYFRGESLSIIKFTTHFVGKFLLIFAIIFLLYIMAAQLFALPQELLIEQLSSLTVLLALSVATMGYVWVRKFLTRPHG